MKKKQVIGIVGAVALFIVTAASSVFVQKASENMLSTMGMGMGNSYFSAIEALEEDITVPKDDFVGVINIEGTIQDVGSSDMFTTVAYDHQGILDFIDEMIETDNNVGLLLNVDSPGGATYEVVDVYDKLAEYKEVTGRPVYAYFASMACSGGYYVAMQADSIYAHQESLIGSIGVIMSSYNYKDLLDKIGVKEINITSGANKAMGSAGQVMTDDQIAIYQSIVDEAYEAFVSAVEQGRKLDRAKVYELADGRIYTSKQALEKGMIDGICGYEDFLEEMQSELGDVEFYEPGQDAETDFFSMLFQKVQDIMPKSETELNMAILDECKNGGLMYYADLT